MEALRSQPEQEFLEHLPLVEHVIAFITRRHHLSSSDAAEFASHVKLKLIEDGYAVFRKFQGRSKLQTYLTVVIDRLFLDYRNAAWGKWRPSAEARRLGPLAILLEELVARDGHSLDESWEILTTNHRLTLDRVEFERIAERLPIRVKRRFESDDALVNVAATDGAADEEIEQRERKARLARALAVLRQVMQALDPQDQLVLALRYQDGRKLADIAALLHVEPRPLYGRVASLHSRLRDALEREGVDASSLDIDGE